MAIPKIIHQIWLGDKESPQAWLQTVRDRHPDWEYRLWTEDNLPPLQNQAAFDATVSYTQQSDLLRYEILHQYGGVYVDADCVCLRPLDDLLEHTFFAGQDNQRSFPNQVACGVIGCTPQHPVLKTCVDYVRAEPTLRGTAMIYTTGPIFFSSVLFAHRVFDPELMKSAKILDERIFYPLRWGPDTHDFGSMDDCYFFHAWGDRHGYDPGFVARIMRLVERGKKAPILPPGQQMGRFLRYGVIPPFVRLLFS